MITRWRPNHKASAPRQPQPSDPHRSVPEALQGRHGADYGEVARPFPRDKRQPTQNSYVSTRATVVGYRWAWTLTFGCSEEGEDAPVRQFKMDK
ncbi:hypothetical protein B296_00036869 [Ensete ventricosum]|uniref:Uncharacterized protein n=1 Tax=Ensete ventricosum TaxID=4639 RepID=A0A427A107_ENSVE|nr:hypothetical protein B296_00036869 [Ensete ventricosum]